MCEAVHNTDITRTTGFVKMGGFLEDLAGVVMPLWSGV